MSNPEKIYNDIVRKLESAGANLRCTELIRGYRSLGFDVRDGTKQGHKVVTHPGISSFSADGFTCGHGTNPEIKRVYVRKAVRLLKRYKAELIKYLGEA